MERWQAVTKLGQNLNFLLSCEMGWEGTDIMVKQLERSGNPIHGGKGVCESNGKR